MMLVGACSVFADGPENGSGSEGSSLQENTSHDIGPLPDVVSPVTGMNSPFIENKGQWDPSTLFMAETAFGHVALGIDGIYYDIQERVRTEQREGILLPVTDASLIKDRPPIAVKGHVVKLSFIEPEALRAEGLEPVETYYNYFLGDDPSRWVSRAKGFEKVVYHGLWDGIDLHYLSKDGALKYEFHVADAQSVDNIGLAVEGAELMAKDDSIVLRTPLTDIVDTGLVTYLTRTKQVVPSSFRTSMNILGYQVYDVEDHGSIVIDPLVYATYLGGPSSDYGIKVKCDSSGHGYITGITIGSDFPTTPGAYDSSGMLYKRDVFVSKLEPDGDSLVYSTYLGGRDQEANPNIAVDADGCAYLTGWTTSSDFPRKSNPPGTRSSDRSRSSPNIFVTKLASDGASLVYSRVDGRGDYDKGRSITVDDSGCAYIAATSGSNDFPTTEGAYQTECKGLDDVVVMKFSADGNDILYSTYIGGENGDWGEDIEVDSSGNAYVTGGTVSYEFPTTQGAYQRNKKGMMECFVLKLNHNASKLLYSTFVSGDEYNEGKGIEIDEDGNSYVTGYTHSKTFPTTANAFDTSFGGVSDAFVFKLNPTGSNLIYSTYIGGESSDGGRDIALKADGSTIVTGSTHSTMFPTSPNAVDKTSNGNGDMFIVGISDNGESITYSTLLGGSEVDRAYGIDLCTDGSVIITGVTESDNFPVTTGSFQTNLSGQEDAVILRLDPTGGPGIMVPGIPGNLSAEVVNDEVHLAWDAPVDGGTPIRNFTIYRALKEGSFINILTQNNTTYNDTEMPVGKPLRYHVSARNALGEGPRSETVNVTIIVIPGQPSNLTAQPKDGTVNLSWDPPGFDGGASFTYMVYRGLTRNGEKENVATVDEPFYKDSSVTNGVAYYYQVSAVNVRGESPRTLIVEATPYGPPSEPLNPIISQDGSFIHISWDRPELDGGFLIEWYRIYRGETLEGIEFYTQVPVTTTEFLDENVYMDWTYHYQVSAETEKLEGPRSRTVTIFLIPPPDPPSAPIGAGVSAGDGFVDLEWDHPLDDGGALITHYLVYRGTVLGKEAPMEGTFKGTEAKDTNVTNGIRYYYRIVAVNAAGEGESSPVLMARPVGLPGSPSDLVVEPGRRTLTISWTPPAQDGGRPIFDYILYRGHSPENIERMKSLGNVTSYQDTTVKYGNKYHYAIIAVTEEGEGERSSIVQGTPIATEPGKAGSLSLIEKKKRVEISWTAPTDDGGSDVLGYIILRGTSPDDMEVFVDVEGATDYIDDTVRTGKKYYYSVVVVNAVGDGEPTDVVEIKLRKDEESPGISVPLALLGIISMVLVMRRFERSR